MISYWVMEVGLPSVFPHIAAQMGSPITLHIRFIVRLYLLGLLFFTAFRLSLITLENHYMDTMPEPVSLMGQALVMGWRFDTVILCYLLILPLAVVAVMRHFSLYKPVFEGLKVFLLLVFPVSFFIILADIPYFHHYFSRMTTAIFQWTDSPAFMAKMVLQDPTYYGYFALFFASVYVYYGVLKMIFRGYENQATLRLSGKANHAKTAALSVFCIAVMILGIRGRVAEKSPIRVGTAYFSNNAFANQVGLNPVFTLLRSWLDGMNPDNRQLHLIDPKEAVRFAAQELLKDGTPLPDISPIARSIKPANQTNAPKNVVLVIMESMSAEKMGHFGNPHKLTPTLDELYKQSLAFENIYSAGIHTMNGIYSTLFGFPALLKQHPMNGVPIPKMSGFPSALKPHGYQTLFFTTHDDQFDNVGGFLSANGFETIISQKDYPFGEVKSTLGVPDHYLFEFAIPRLRQAAERQKPFFAAMMTASDHGPYVLPDNIPFKPKPGPMEQQIIEYADWSIGHFLDIARKEPWFEETVFVFIADHGGLVGSSPYDMALSLNHVPLLIYQPNAIKPIINPGLGGQIDVFPTVMGILNLPYVNNTLGVDLQKTHRPYAYFSADDKIGCIDQEDFMIFRTEGAPSLHSYRAQNPENKLIQKQAKFNEMKRYAFSMLQTGQEMLKGKNTAVEDVK